MTLLLFFFIALQAQTEEIAPIVITAEQVEKSENDITKEEIAFGQADHISTVINKRSGVLIHRGNGIEHLTAIRSPVLTAGAGAGSFSYTLDAIPLRSATFGNINGLFEAPFQLANSIEIEKGPASVLLPPNSQHGSINITLPSTHNHKKFQASTNNNGLASTQYTQSLAKNYWAGVNLIRDPGFRDDSCLYSGDLVLKKEWFDDKYHRDLTIVASFIDQDTAGYIEGFQAYKDDDLNTSNPNPDAYRKSKSIRIQSKLLWRLKNQNSLKLQPYFRYTQMDFLMHFLPSKALEESQHASVGVLSRYKLKNLTLGFDSDFTKGSLKETQSIDPGIPNYPVGVHYDYQVDVLQLSPLISYQNALTQHLLLTLGTRLDYFNYYYDNKTDSDIFGKFQRISDRNNHFTALSSQIDFKYYLSNKNKIQLLLRRRSRAPQTTDLYRLESQQVADQITEETVDSIELGYHSVPITVSTFFMSKKNFFFRDVDGFNVVNGKTLHFGIEAQLSIQLPKHFYLQLDYTLAKHYYNFNNNVASASNSTESISKGDLVDSAPNYFGNLRFGYNHSDKTHIELEWVNMGRYYINASNIHEYRGHNILNFRLKKKISKKLAVNTIVTNLLNADYAERADYFRSTYRYFPGEGRGIKVSASYLWN